MQQASAKRWSVIALRLMQATTIPLRSNTCRSSRSSGLRGGLLRTYRSVDDQHQGFKASPATFNQQIHHFAAQIYGNVAVATYYLVGSVKIGEELSTGTWRVTEVWIRQGGEWKEVHHQESPLQATVR
ncbi:MAG: nuclear transport factor 2 family protein [bacterium]